MLKVNRTYPFWLSIMRFAYKRIKYNQDKMPIGIPGNRDPENPCTGYSPRKRLSGDYPAECETDGHYLCKECVFNINKTP